MSQAISPGIIIPILTWTGIVLFVTPFILSCCIKYCRSHPQSKMTKCINFPIFLTKSCINATFKHKKYILDSDTIHVNTHTQQDIERGPNTTTTHNNDSVNVKMISSIVKLFSEMLFVFICPSLSRNKAVFIVNKLHNIYITRLNLKSLEKAIQTFVCDKILSSFLCNLLFHSLVLYDFP